MADLIVEDGTGKEDADAYISLVDAAIYHDNYSPPERRTQWAAASDEDKKASIRTATAWMDAIYDWRGLVAVNTQALEWPRVAVFDSSGRRIASDVVPRRVSNCCAYLAGENLTSPLSSSIDREAKSERVGPVAVEYMDRAAETVRYPHARRLVRAYIVGTTSQIKVVR